MKEKRNEFWIDNIKVIACALVVIGHFFQSMTQSGIYPENTFLPWFDKTIYYFHVQLFFLCSGYLYQKFSCVNSLQSWGKNILKKALNLGVPYFTFSIATWCLKNLFSGYTNMDTAGPAETLFVHPLSPYWYLYCLFFIFLITPTFSSRKHAVIGLSAAIVLKAVSIFLPATDIFALDSVLLYGIWFVIGMCLSSFRFTEHIRKLPFSLTASALFIVFITSSVLIYKYGIYSPLAETVLGLIGCGFVVMAVSAHYGNRDKNNRIFAFFSKYTMPVYLMHTIFAAALRSLLLKVGIDNMIIHTFAGLVISFAGPIVAAVIMSKVRWLNFFLYPGKYVKIK